MKLLVITQKVDINDDILGFFHGWIEKLAEKLESIDVICLQEGKYDLPKNVSVYSLGKERFGSHNSHIFRKFAFLLKLYRYAWKLLPKNDLLFVHMNHRYIILLWLLTKIFKKPIILWKTHRGRQPLLKTAIKLSKKVLTASSLSLDYVDKKIKIIGHGINTDLFSLKSYPNNEIKKIVSVGRISPIKNQLFLVKIAYYLINELGFKNVKFEIIGEPKLKKDFLYFKKIKRLIREYNLSDYFVFKNKIPNREMPKIYYNSEMLIDLAEKGGLDKAPLEAMACGRIVFSCQPALREVLGNYKKELSIDLKKPENIARKIKKYLELKKQEKEKIGQDLREIIIKKHSLDNLTDKLVEIFKSVIT